ncbi:MAG: NAD-dependent deacylase [Spirochaetota bacterium]|nr:NAD-dependent deacylase [Spirochaetota bacterium]
MNDTSRQTRPDEQIEKAAEAIRKARYCTAFTGAGISVESGIPPFRGENGIWNTYNPIVLDLGYFYQNPKESWKAIKEIFYEFFGQALPNAAHTLLAEMEKHGLLKTLITQNIDNLHYEAGSREVVEYHGNSRTLVCPRCGARTDASEDIFEELPPRCSCGGVWKPDFVFFGESIPFDALQRSEEAAERTDCMLLIGTTGEVYPAALIPREAARNGAIIIEINPAPSLYTHEITDIFIQTGAVEAGEALLQGLF